MSVQQTLILVWALALVALTLVAAMQYQRNGPLAQTMNISRTTVQVGEHIVHAEVADTLALQTRGLSGRAGLAEGEGMLFIFDEAGVHGIWMKDMRFSIDIIWAADDGTILTIEERISPYTYPQSFQASSLAARYVLEVPAGFVEKSGIQEGMVLEFE